MFHNLQRGSSQYAESIRLQIESIRTSALFSFETALICRPVERHDDRHVCYSRQLFVTRLMFNALSQTDECLLYTSQIRSNIQSKNQFTKTQGPSLLTAVGIRPHVTQP